MSFLAVVGVKFIFTVPRCKRHKLNILQLVHRLITCADPLHHFGKLAYMEGSVLLKVKVCFAVKFALTLHRFSVVTEGVSDADFFAVRDFE
jgi:hypothetical protein